MLLVMENVEIRMMGMANFALDRGSFLMEEAVINPATSTMIPFADPMVKLMETSACLRLHNARPGTF